MASGFITGYQHRLLDHPDLTKEEFIKFCDDIFYHLSHFNITVEEAKNRKQKRKSELLAQLQKAEVEVEKHLSKTQDEWEAEYKEYVSECIEANRKYRESYFKEVERMNLINQYVEQMRPHLEYVWREFKQPELFQRDISSFDEYKSGRISSSEHIVRFRKRDLEELNSEEHDKNNQVIEDYEAKKKAFLEGE